MMTNRRFPATHASEASRQPRLRWLGCSALSLGLLLGFPLVILGCWLAATGGTIRPREPEPEPEPEVEAELPPVAPG